MSPAGVRRLQWCCTMCTAVLSLQYRLLHGVMQHAAWSSIDRRPHDKRAGGRWSAEANQEAGGGGGGRGGANVKITQVPLPPSISQQLAWSWSVHTVDSTKNVKIGVEWRHVIYLCCLLSACVCLEWYLLIMHPIPSEVIRVLKFILDDQLNVRYFWLHIFLIFKMDVWIIIKPTISLHGWDKSDIVVRAE